MKVKILVILISLILVLNGFLLVFGSGQKNDEIEEVDDEIKTEGLANSPWPSFGRDKENTHLSPYDTSHVDGTERWNFETNDSIRSSPSIGNDGTIYIGSVDNNLYAINPEGTEKWSFETNDSVRTTPAIGDDGTIYFGSYDNKLYALNPDGTEKWNFTTDNTVQSSPAIGDDGTIYFGSSDHHLYALNPDGTEKWRFSVRYDCDYSPAIADDGTIYVGSGLKEPELFAVHPNGTEKWSFDPDFGGTLSSAPTIADDGTIYYGSNDDNLYAVNPNGTEKWSFNTGGSVYSSPAIGSDGTIYFGSDDYNMYALNPDGTEKWNFTTDWYFRSPPAIGADGTIYVGCYDENLYTINPDGTEKWNFTTDNTVQSSPAIASDGTVYISSFDSNLYAIGEEEEKHNLTLQQPVGEGTVEVDGQEVKEWPYKETYDNNTEVRLKAVPDEGWQFKEWDGIYKSGTEITEIMDEDREITANFEKRTSDIEASIIQPDDEEEFKEGDEVKIEFEIDNLEDEAIEILLLIENEEGDIIINESWEGEEIKTDGSYRGNYTWETENPGDYNIMVRVNGLYLDVFYDEDNVMIIVEEDENGTPGFTSMFILSAAVIAVAIYQKKKR